MSGLLEHAMLSRLSLEYAASLHTGSTGPPDSTPKFPA